MQTYSTCYFKDPVPDHQFIKQWVSKLEELNNRQYERNNVPNHLGNTVVWSLNSDRTTLPFLFIFPGFRTSSLFWDLDNGLQLIEDRYRIYLVETNGQPTLSDGNTPDIKTLDYGHWAAEVITHFTPDRVNVAGSSFGGLVCLKLAIAAPDKVDQIFLLNPGCFQAFSLSLKNLFYNLLPIVQPSVKNVKRFLDKAVFYPPAHYLPEERMQMIIDYEVFALTRHVDKAQKPYAMKKEELQRVEAAVHLIVGERDLLFPYLLTIKAAEQGLKNLKRVNVLPDTGHGIETLREALLKI
ncbi:alpha/beta fold hydrolase [Daejeonella rubra]|nr:alpha/beta hydrolase [Daejeonella rubra]